MERVGKNYFEYVWRIENYSYSYHQVDECITSPIFQTCLKEGSCWCLKIYPRGESARQNSTTLYLQRVHTEWGFESIQLDYHLYIIRHDGVIECMATVEGSVFGKGSMHEPIPLLPRDELLAKHAILLPNDTLTVQCRLSLSISVHHPEIRFLAKTTLWTHRQLFLWHAGEFNHAVPHQPGCFSKMTVSKADVLLELKGDQIYVHLQSKDNLDRVFRLKIGIVDSDQSTSLFIIDEYMFNPQKWKIILFPFTKSELLERKNRYLANDHLTLHCDMTYATRINSGCIELTIYDKVFI